MRRQLDPERVYAMVIIYFVSIYRVYCDINNNELITIH
jgi:hypothetical protein